MPAGLGSRRRLVINPAAAAAADAGPWAEGGSRARLHSLRLAPPQQPVHGPRLPPRPPRAASGTWPQQPGGDAHQQQQQHGYTSRSSQAPWWQFWARPAAAGEDGDEALRPPAPLPPHAPSAAEERELRAVNVAVVVNSVILVAKLATWMVTGSGCVRLRCCQPAGWLAAERAGVGDGRRGRRRCSRLPCSLSAPPACPAIAPSFSGAPAVRDAVLSPPPTPGPPQRAAGGGAALVCRRRQPGAAQARRGALAAQAHARAPVRCAAAETNDCVLCRGLALALGRAPRGHVSPRASTGLVRASVVPRLPAGDAAVAWLPAWLRFGPGHPLGGGPGPAVAFPPRHSHARCPPPAGFHKEKYVYALISGAGGRAAGWVFGGWCAQLVDDWWWWWGVVAGERGKPAHQ